jgi:hypothetical protein
METLTHCQSCRRRADERSLSYRKGEAVLRHENLLQCDVCERYACAECLQVYDILSEYDFLCHECAGVFRGAPARTTRGH